MATQVFKIGGADFTDCIKDGGLKWTRNDIDASNAGRDKTGRMRRKRVATKAKLQVSCRKLTHARLKELNEALFPQTVKVTYLDPRLGERTATFYGSSVDAATMMSFGGHTWWEGVTFSLVEV